MAKAKKTKPKVRTRPSDSAEYLDSPEAIAEYLSEALEDSDPAFIARAIGTAARAGHERNRARGRGLPRESLSRAVRRDQTGV
jgi:probable addiction module antidote protein